MLRKILLVCGILPSVLYVATTALPRTQAAPPQSGRLRIGVFDSRGVALAYYNSPEAQSERKQMIADLAAAKAAKDQRRVDALMHEGPAVQSLMHYQVFSTASIPNVLELMTAELPKIARDARVSMIVSRWEVAFRATDVEYVDVTMEMAAVFKPTPALLEHIKTVGAKAPMGLMEAVKSLRPDR